MLQRALEIGGILSGIVAGLTQAYPGIIPGGEFYVGWTAVILGGSSLLLPFIRRRIKFVRLIREIQGITSRTPSGQHVKVIACWGDTRSQIVARNLEKALKEKGCQVLFEFQMRSVGFQGIRVEGEPPRTIEVGEIEDIFPVRAQ